MRRESSGRLVVSAALLVATLVLLHLRASTEVVPPRKPLEGFPMQLGDWRLESSDELTPRAAAVLRASDFMSRAYRDHDGRYASLYIGYFESQRRGTTMHSPKNCLPGGGWEPLDVGRASIDIPGAVAPITAARYVVQKENEQLVVLYWYQARGRTYAGEVGARLALVQSALLDNRSDGAIVRVVSPVYESVPATIERLSRFIREIHPLLDDYLPP